MAAREGVDRQLSDKQEQAIELLVAGKTVTEAAKELGISRQTLVEWREHDPAFVAEINRRRQEIWQGGVERLRSLVDRAVAVLEEDLQSGDRRLRQTAAVHVLRAVGLYGKDRLAPSGPVTAEEVENRWETEREWAMIFRGLPR